MCYYNVFNIINIKININCNIIGDIIITLAYISLINPNLLIYYYNLLLLLFCRIIYIDAPF